MDLKFINRRSLQHQFRLQQRTLPGFSSQHEALQSIDGLLKMAFLLKSTVDLSIEHLDLLLGAGCQAWHALQTAVLQSAARQHSLG